MFNSSARAAGRTVFGAVLIAGALVLVHRLMTMRDPHAYGVLLAVWTFAFAAGSMVQLLWPRRAVGSMRLVRMWLSREWCDQYPSGDNSRRDCHGTSRTNFDHPMRVHGDFVAGESAHGDGRVHATSFVVPAVGIALLLPLTLHALVALAARVSTPSFDMWAGLSLVITWPAHLVLAFMVARRAKQLAEGRAALATWRIYGTVVCVSAVPFVIFFMLPPILVALTGLAIAPLIDRMEPFIERERGVVMPSAVAHFKGESYV